MAPKKTKAKSAQADRETTLKKGRVMEAFALLDRNKDGHIDLQELGVVLQTLDEPFWNAERVAGLLNAVDKNADGRIQLEELMEWVFKEGSADDAAAGFHVIMNRGGLPSEADLWKTEEKTVLVPDGWGAQPGEDGGYDGVYEVILLMKAKMGGAHLHRRFEIRGGTSVAVAEETFERPNEWEVSQHAVKWTDSHTCFINFSTHQGWKEVRLVFGSPGSMVAASQILTGDRGFCDIRARYVGLSHSVACFVTVRAVDDGQLRCTNVSGETILELPIEGLEIAHLLSRVAGELNLAQSQITLALPNGTIITGLTGLVDSCFGA